MPELMTVAVSRAEDLLIVFAAANRWAIGPVFSVMSHFATRTAPEPETAGDASAADRPRNVAPALY